MKRILLAEPHAPTRDFIARALHDAGYEVVAAGASAAAYELYAAQHPDAAVVAADLPRDGGQHLAQRLRTTDPRSLVVVTDKAHLGKAKGVQSVLDLRANAYIADPTKKELAERLAQLLAQAGAAAVPPSQRGIAATLAHAPSLQGDLKNGAVARGLHQLWRTFRSGVLVVNQREATRRVYLHQGAAVNFDSDVRSESLGRWLVETRRISEEQYLQSLEAMAGGALSAGAALVAVGALEPGEPLYGTLRGHVRAMVGRCVAVREGRLRFHPGEEWTSEVQALELPPLAPLLEGARAGLPLKFFADELKPVLRAYPARTAEFQKLLPAMALGTADLRLAVNLTGRVTARDFLADRRGDLKDCYALLWFFSLVGAIAFHPQPQESADAGRYADLKGAPRGRKALPPEMADELRQAALRVLPGSYFKALGLDIAATIDDVERAYHDVMSKFHPDAYAEYDVGDLEDLLAQVQDKVNAAYRVLSVEEKRNAYLAYLLSRQDDLPRRVNGVDVEAEIAVKRGEKALRERRFGEAVAAFRDASERNPKEPEYAALLAFAQLRDASLPPDERARAARKAAKKALALDPQCVRAMVSMALVEDAEGDPAGARKRLLAALQLAPGNEVAKRALQRVNRGKK